MKKIKESCGIALFSDMVNPKLLLLKKRCTYYFCEFVDGKYKLSDELHLEFMFNHMTPTEKTLILSGNFDDIWFKRWLTHHLCRNDITDHYKDEKKINLSIEWYRSCENRYLETYHSGSLKKLISKSKSICGVWELPKGRRNIQEQRLQCAIREFHEEVDILPTDYRLIDTKPLFFELIDKPIIYKFYIYVAVLVNKKWEPDISFEKFFHFNEASDIGWYTLGDIKRLRISEKNKCLLLEQYSKSFKKLKKA